MWTFSYYHNKNHYWIPYQTEGKHRPIIARIHDSQTRSSIFKNVSRLADTGHFVQQQMPPSRVERKQFALPTYLDLKKDKKNKAVLSKGTLYVKNRLQSQFLEHQLPSLIIRDDTPELTLFESREKRDSGSSFRGYCAEAESLDDVALVREHLIANKPEVAAANHVIYAYRFQSARGKTTENFKSDRDWGAGHALLKCMKENAIVNTVFVATHKCNPGSQRIGKKRFSNITELCLQAHKSMPCDSESDS